MTKEFQHINFRIDDRIARITFARPPLNVFDIAMMREIGQALNECLPLRDLAAMVFDATPDTRAFSAGVAVEEHAPETVFQMLDSFHSVFRLLAQISRPVIAVVDGPALGGGCELVAACDIVIASERARFGQPEIKLGVFPPVAAILLPRIIGEKRARELIMLGDMIDAGEARRLGLVSYVVPTAALDLGGRSGFESVLTEVENLYLNELMKTEDASEGVHAFMEKRKPEWRNK